MQLKTRILAVDRDEPDDRALSEAAGLLRAGELVAFATETVYGLGADATNDLAVFKIFEAKGRPSINPLIVHVAEVADARRYVTTWPDRAERLAEHFWPGPLTLVLPKSSAICGRATAGQDTVGLRIPSTMVARRLIELADRPIAAPSANRSTGISPTEARHVAKDLDGRIPLILDSGSTSVGIESTVLDLCHATARLLRPGTLGLDELQAILGERIESPFTSAALDETKPFKSPGQMAIHYAPRTPTYRIEFDRSLESVEASKFGLLCFGSHATQTGTAPFVKLDLIEPKRAAAALYGLLHEWDELGLECILIVMPPPTPDWEAIRDRLNRASRPWPDGSRV